MSSAKIVDIAREFGLEDVDPTELRRRLQDRRAALHPDRHNGSFESEQAEAEFHRLSEAIATIDARDASAGLVPADSIPGIVKAVRDALAPEVHERREIALNEKLVADLERSVSRYRPPHATPRFGATGLAAVLTALWAFPGMVSGNPVLAGLIDTTSSAFLVVWVNALALAGMMWFVAWRQEERHRESVDALRSEPEQNRIFRAFLDQHCDELDSTFAKDELVDFIRWRPRHRSDRSHDLTDIVFRPRVDHVTAQSVVDVMISRLEARGIIEPTTTRSLSAVYRLVGSNR